MCQQNKSSVGHLDVKKVSWMYYLVNFTKATLVSDPTGLPRELSIIHIQDQCSDATQRNSMLFFFIRFSPHTMFDNVMSRSLALFFIFLPYATSTTCIYCESRRNDQQLNGFNGKGQINTVASSSGVFSGWCEVFEDANPFIGVMSTFSSIFICSIFGSYYKRASVSLTIFTGKSQVAAQSLPWIPALTHMLTAGSDFQPFSPFL